VAATTPAKRSHANVRAVGYGHENYAIPVPRKLECSKATAVAPAETGRGGGRTGGVLDHGTFEEDDRVTWETLTSPPSVEVGPSKGNRSEGRGKRGSRRAAYEL
jgi:hypothetical protein